MEGILNLLMSMPDYVKAIFTTHTLIACVGVVIFIFVLFFSNRAARILRTLFVLGIITMGCMGFITKAWPQLCLSVLILLLLIIIRLVWHIINTIRTERRNKRIEERALEKAAKRRGSWKNRKGYSGDRKPIAEPDYVPETMGSDEIESVIRNEKTEYEPVKTIVPPVTEELKPEPAAEQEAEVPADTKTDTPKV